MSDILNTILARKAEEIAERSARVPLAELIARVGEASPGLEDEDRPALLGQAERGHRAAETGADDQDIDIDRGAVGGMIR